MPSLRVGIGLAVFSAVMWAAWLGWDNEYYLDSLGYPAGPYRAWQVIGCGVCIVIGTVVAWCVARDSRALFYLPGFAIVGFAIPWTVDAIFKDDSGLFIVGLGMLLVGGYGGLLVVTLLASLVVRPRHRPPLAHVVQQG